MDNLLIINKKDLTKDKIIGYGDEAFIYNYQNRYAIKLFNDLKRPENRNKFQRKLRKINEMFQLKDPNCAFPIGFVSFDGVNIEGYYTLLVKHNGVTKDFDDLELLRSERKIIEYLIKADTVLQRIHKYDLIVGDIKEDNIMIDENGNPIYVDTDNYKYKCYPFDLIPDRAGTLYNTYQTKTTSLRDNDILVYSLMSLYLLTKLDNFYRLATKEQITRGVDKLSIDGETRKELDYIFSDRLDKPYIGPVLKELKPNHLLK